MTTVMTDGVLTRVSDLIQSKVHKLLDKVEDPVEALEQEIKKCKQDQARVEDAERSVRKQIILIDGQIETAEKKVEDATTEAKDFLLIGKESGRLEEAKGIAEEILDKVAPEKEQVTILAKQRETLNETLSKLLDEKSNHIAYVQQMEKELGVYRARLQTAEALKDIQGHETTATGTGASTRLERLKERVHEVEAGIKAGEQMTDEPADPLEARKRAFKEKTGGNAPKSSSAAEVDKMLAELE